VSQVDVAVVCRGGGSLTDLWAFCDETLCRTVALLRLPVVSAVGHESDRTLIDDVSAVCCSTPTHAANALVQVDVNTARTDLRSFGSLAARTASTAIGSRGRRLAELACGPERSVRLEHRRLHQLLREVRASAKRGHSARISLASRHAIVLSRKQEAFEATDRAARGQLVRFGQTVGSRMVAVLREESQRLDALSLAERAHDPDRALARGYALVAAEDGDPLTSAAATRERDRIVIRFADDAVPARVEHRDPDER
jgi:exodeoxyribonuclease VII large subunit